MSDRADRQSWAADALSAVGGAGHRLSAARRAVVQLLADHGGGLMALEIAERLRGRVGTASVYRALVLLVELGLLHGVDLDQRGRRYELVLPGGHHHHLVCRHCRRTDLFVDRALETVLERVERGAPYAVTGHDGILRGRCPGCAAAGGAADDRLPAERE
jgi:Fur family transcriptional regulator, ferric uptake regulator